MSHYHVSHGLAGYGPEGDENTPTYESLADALDDARDELSRDVDGCWETARSLAESENYEGAWFEIMRAEELETLRANLDPARAQAPLYRDDAAAYAQLQESQLAEFPVDVSRNERLYVWACEESACVDPRPEETDGYVNEPAYGAVVVSLDGRTIGETAEVNEGFALLARAMRDSHYWPNVWHVNERGNTTLVEILDHDSGSYRFTETSYV